MDRIRRAAAVQPVRWMTRTLAAGLLLAAQGACGAAVAINDTPATPASNPPPATTGTAQDRETIAGRFMIVFGDPPPDSGQPPKRLYTLTDQQGRRWTLTFDEKLYSPPGGVLEFNGKDVEVQGRRTGTDRLLVESMRLR